MGEHLLAHIADQLAEANWMFATVNRDEDAEPLDFPEPLPRPGVPAPARPGEEPDHAAAQLPDPEQLSRFFAQP
ncbi:hypothetical protein [Streptomyces endophyticus]|uniref:hypothetical protein n=1 Tax=Streptomyces endophyticus TaxID=714166 RepID=UPI002DBC3C63|nr:hypothetical protein [Streptomyces endophyticus]